MTKAPKNRTPTDDELRDELRYWPEWIDWYEAQKHVEDIGPVPTHQPRENILRQRTAAEALRRRVISRDIEYQSERGDLTLEDFRAATSSDYMGELWIGEPRLPIRTFNVRLRRAHVYRFWPTRWMGAEGKARLEPTAAPGRPGAPPPFEPKAPQTPRLPELPATKPDDIYRAAWDATLAVVELRREGRWPRKWQDKQLAALNEYLTNTGKDKVSRSTMKNALRWLRVNGFD
jgi:hypothetical protein